MGSAVFERLFLLDSASHLFVMWLPPISRDRCYPPPKSPSCEGDLFVSINKSKCVTYPPNANRGNRGNRSFAKFPIIPIVPIAPIKKKWKANHSPLLTTNYSLLTTLYSLLCHTMHDSESHSGSGFGSKSE